MVQNAAISVNKLAEYIVSRGARQRKILTDRKYPDPDAGKGIFHREATEAVMSYIASGGIDASTINQQLRILAQIVPEKIGTARRINANIDSLERFSDMLDDLDFMGATPSLGHHNPPKLSFFNVAVSVRPEIIMRGTGPKGQKFVGAWKLHFSKSHPHSQESAGYVSAVVQEYCKFHVCATDEIVNPLYCKVIDVASGTVFEGVKATAKRLKDVEAECQNIAGLWPTI